MSRYSICNRLSRERVAGDWIGRDDGGRSSASHCHHERNVSFSILRFSTSADAQYDHSKAVKSAIEQKRNQLNLQNRQAQATANTIHQRELDLSQKKEKLREKVALEKRRDDAKAELVKGEATRLVRLLLPPLVSILSWTNRNWTRRFEKLKDRRESWRMISPKRGQSSRPTNRSLFVNKLLTTRILNRSTRTPRNSSRAFSRSSLVDWRELIRCTTVTPLRESHDESPNARPKSLAANRTSTKSKLESPPFDSRSLPPRSKNPNLNPSCETSRII